MIAARITATAALLAALAAGLAQPAHADPGPITWKATAAAPITLDVVDVTASGEFVAALTVEADRWNAAGLPVTMHVTAEPGGPCDATRFHRVAVCRGDVDGFFAYTVTTKYDPAHYEGASITVTPTFPDSIRLRVLLGHELGHVLGLTHSSSAADSIMYPAAATARCDGIPGAQDYADVRAMYGTAGPFTVPADHDNAPGLVNFCAADQAAQAAQAAPAPAAPAPAAPASPPPAKPAPARQAAPRTIPAPHPAPTATPAPVSSPRVGVPGILSTRW